MNCFDAKVRKAKYEIQLVNESSSPSWSKSKRIHIVQGHNITKNVTIEQPKMQTSAE